MMIRSMTRSFSIFVFGICIFISSLAQASVYLEVSGGHAAGLPIAISLQGAEESSEMANVIRADLGNSGQFRSLPERQMPEYPASQEGVHFGVWKKIGIEHVVVGQVQKAGMSRYTVNFELLNVFNKHGEDTAYAPLLQMRFDNIRSQDLRALAHHISDLIFEKLIGIKGIFSTRLAYVAVDQNGPNATYTLEVADQDGYNPKELMRTKYPLLSPSWSPDGKRIAFVSFENNRSGIHIVDVSTGRIQKVSSFPGINGAPAWSPDGRTLALVLSKEGAPKIYTMNVSSKSLQRITSGNSIDTEPRWDPSGRSIYFTSNRSGQPQIYRIDLTTGNTERITYRGNYNAHPCITPDGRKLVTMHRDGNGPFSIAVQTLGSQEFKILTHARLDESPSLAPNGMMVIYGSQDGSRGILGAVSLDGRIRLRLPAQSGNVQEPAWSPFLF